MLTINKVTSHRYLFQVQNPAEVSPKKPLAVGKMWCT